MKKIVLNAIPFGFGPVSKAVAIAKSVSNIMDVEWQLLGTGISLEFMKREGLNARVLVTDDSEPAYITASKISKDADGALILMDNEWANALAPQMPVFFADSLGFMWNESDFISFPNMDQMERYYVQDIFGAYDKMKATGLPNLSPVPAIIDTASEDKEGAMRREIVHLGGLFNPMNPSTTQVYIKGMQRIFNDMGLEQPLGLMSQTAIDAFPELSNSFETASLPHAQSLGAMKSSSFTWSSPGLTTILEMADSGTRTAPLPPQNYSQALNIGNMVRYHGAELHEVWHFLAGEYQEIVPDMPEELGVEKITALNASKLESESFRKAYVGHALDARNSASTVPESMRSKGNGARAIARDIQSFYL